MKLEDRDAAVKTALDALLLKLPGVEGGEMTGLAAYFVNDRMFACIWNGAVGIRVPGTVATELQFSRDNIAPFQPKGRSSTREWVEVRYADPAGYAKDLALLKQSLEFVKTGKSG